VNDLPRQVENRLVLSRSGRPWLGFSLQGLGLRLLCLLLGLPGGAVLVSRDNRRRLLRGPNREFNWPIVDQEFNQFALQQLDEVDTLLLGRVTYQFMASDWPPPAAEQDALKGRGEDERPAQARRVTDAPGRHLGHSATRRHGWSAASAGSPTMPSEDHHGHPQ
jgi:hypothetical protein